MRKPFKREQIEVHKREEEREKWARCMRARGCVSVCVENHSLFERHTEEHSQCTHASHHIYAYWVVLYATLTQHNAHYMHAYL